MCQVEVEGGSGSQRMPRARVIKSPWEKFLSVAMPIVLAAAVGAIGAVIVMWREFPAVKADVADNTSDIEKLRMQSADRYTEATAGVDWERQLRLDHAQDELLLALDARADAMTETLVRVTTLMEKYDLSISGNFESLQDLRDRMARLEMRVEARHGGAGP